MKWLVKITVKKTYNIITKSDENLQPISWQSQLADAFKSSAELLEYLQIARSKEARLKNNFPCLVTKHFADLMQKNNLKDPLLLQVLPQDEENIMAANFDKNPVADANSSPQTGIIHKYKNRCLLIFSPACAIHCRYCFRRHFDYKNNFLSSKQLDAALNYINQDPKLDEVILSGGDPLMSKDTKLAQLSASLNSIAQIKRLRIHTRLPVVLPNRIDKKLLNWLENSSLQNIFVLHINHSNEISPQLVSKVKLLKATGALVLNQSVFLKGVNDNVQTLTKLSQDLFDAGIMPYYLNLLDKVEGSFHFFIDDEQALKIYSQVAENLSGYMLPKLVRDLGKKTYKQIIAPNF